MKIAEQIRGRQEKECRDIWGGLPLIIFVTGHNEHMQDAFGVHAFAYLLKPFEKAEFYKVYEQMLSVWKKQKPDSGRYLLIKTRGEVKRIPVGQIVYIESEKIFCIFQTKKLPIMAPWRSLPANFRTISFVYTRGIS